LLLKECSTNLNNGQNFVEHSKKYVKTKKKIVIKSKNPKNIQNRRKTLKNSQNRKSKKSLIVFTSNVTFALTVVSGL